MRSAMDKNTQIKKPKSKKDNTELKAFGMLHEYANPDLIPLEKNAFELAIEEKHGKVKKKYSIIRLNILLCF